ncbi:hypothetical protein F0252_16750 [Vibrio hepatarius]|nr:hypothetical protein [Vibrio hepatarius]
MSNIFLAKIAKSLPTVGYLIKAVLIRSFRKKYRPLDSKKADKNCQPLSVISSCQMQRYHYLFLPECACRFLHGVQKLLSER